MGVGIIFDIIIIGILILSIWLGYKKGLTKSLLKIFSFLIAIIISLILFKPIANLVITQTDIVNNLQTTLSNTFKNEEQKNKEKNDEKEDNDEENQISENEESNKQLENIFNKYIEKKIYEAGNELKEQVIDTATREIAIFIVNICIYILLFILIRIILIFVKALSELITKIPGIKQCDELGGGVFGALRACIIILLIFTVASIIMAIVPSDGVIDIINQSIITKFIYENNIIIKFIL